MARLPRGVVTAVCVLILAVAAVEVRVPMFVERPLEPLTLNDTLVVDGESAAELGSTYQVGLIGRRRATVLRALGAAVRSDHRLRPEGVVVPPGLDDAHYVAERRDMFARSIDEAGAAALTFLGRPVPHRSGGVAVIDVVAGGPADGTLETADVILAVNGEPVTAPSDFRDAVGDDGEPVALVIERRAEQRRVQLDPAPFDAGDRRQTDLGVVTSLAEPRVMLPLDIELDAGRVGGPSAGLMVALTVLDVLDDDRDLAAGRRVAGTGRITADGHVRSVSAVPTKVDGAISAGADVFVVPESQREQAEQAADGQIHVVGAKVLADAVEGLAASGGRAQNHDW